MHAATSETSLKNHECKSFEASAAEACLQGERCPRKGGSGGSVGKSTWGYISRRAPAPTVARGKDRTGGERAMSNRSKRTLVVANAEPAFVQSCLTKWSKGLQRGAKWDKVSCSLCFQHAPPTHIHTHDDGFCACYIMVPCLLHSWHMLAY